MKFADIIAPISEKEFFADYFQKKYLLVRGTPEKFAQIFNWHIFNSILSVTQNWNEHTLRLLIDENHIPPDKFCRKDSDRNHRPAFVPIAQKVMEYVGQGASLVCNEVDSLHPALAQIGDELERVFDARVQANIYCSRKARQAFKAHFDTHEVFVFHAEGAKKWHIYQGRPENPINNEAFKNLPADERKKMAGNIIDEFTLNKGDFLYVPRGLFHDALADDDYSLHITFGANMLLGVDLLTQFFDYMMTHNPHFRASFPLNARHDKEFIAQLRTESDKFWGGEMPQKMMENLRKQRGFPRQPINLPINADEVVYRVALQNVHIQTIQGKEVLVHGAHTIPIPPKYAPAMHQLLRHQQCTRASLGKFLSRTEADQFIVDCQKMKLL